MYKIVNEIRAGKYVVLAFDQPVLEKLYSKVEISGKEYDVVPCYGITDIVIKSDDSFVGKEARLL